MTSEKRAKSKLSVRPARPPTAARATPAGRDARSILDEIEPASVENAASYVEAYRLAFLAWGRRLSTYHAFKAITVAAMRAIEERDSSARMAGIEPSSPDEDPNAKVEVPLWAAQAILMATMRMEGHDFDDTNPTLSKRMTLAEAFGLAGASKGKGGLVASMERAQRNWAMALAVADLERHGVSTTPSVVQVAEQFNVEVRSVWRILDERPAQGMGTWIEIARATLAVATPNRPLT
jgi:hypothetical protein